MCTTMLKHQKIVHTTLKCICVFFMTLEMITHYFRTQRKLVGFYN